MRRIVALLLLVLVSWSLTACVKPREVEDMTQTPSISTPEPSGVPPAHVATPDGAIALIPKGEPKPLVADAKSVYAISQEDFLAWSDDDTIVLSPELIKIDGQKVKITGYVGVFSPEEKGYFYLVRSPEITCSFCVGSDLADQIILTIYLPKGKTQRYTSSPIEVVGVLQLADVEDPDGMINFLNMTEAQVKILK